MERPVVHGDFVIKASRFASPEELAELLERERADLTKEDFFNNPKHQPVKDAWQAAVFALGYQEILGKPVEVRLSSQERFPDFQLRVEGAVHDFEAVMVVRQALGIEFRGDKSTGPVRANRPWSLPPLDTGPLRTAVAKKVAKHYQGRVHLLVYLNAAGAGGDYAALAREVNEESRDAFESVWLLTFGNEPGKAGDGKNFIACARPSPLLAPAPGWIEVPGEEPGW